MAAPRRGPGRPRDTRIDDSALGAVRELLAEKGFESTTIQAVAERAGIHASAIYRRWPSRIEMIEEAVFPGLNPVSVRPTGDLHRDLRRFVRAYLAALNDPATREAVAGLRANGRSTSRVRPPDFYARVSARPQFQAILDAAPDGTVDAHVDPDDVFDMLLGAVLARTVLAEASVRRRPAERIVELLLRVLAPRQV